MFFDRNQMYVEGKNRISAKLILDSISPTNVRMTTFELVYPRFILSEVNTHRLLSKNSASSRAIPVATLVDMMEKTPAMPVYWGKNKPGMSASEELVGQELELCKALWLEGRDNAAKTAEALIAAGLHKQVANRVGETYHMMKTVLSGTEFANLLWLRNHDAAQPEFHELAKCIDSCLKYSIPQILKPGQWHLPYVKTKTSDISQEFFDTDNAKVSFENAKKISASCCAQVSYRKLNESLEKSLEVYDKLVGMDRSHSSPFEHQATPISYVEGGLTDQEAGVTHQRRDGSYWSGNLKGWIQYRQLLPNEAKW